MVGGGVGGVSSGPLCAAIMKRAVLTGLEVVAVEERLAPLEEVVQLSLDEPSLRCAGLLVVGKKRDERLFRPCEPSGRSGRLLVREERRVVGRVRGSNGVET